MPADPFTLSAATTHTIGRAAFRAARPLLSWVLRAGTFRALYRDLPRASGQPFDEAALEALDIGVACAALELARLPRAGSLIVAANHPQGALDGLALAAVVRRIRPDVRLLANHLLARIPELHASCFFVDPFDGPSAATRSLAGLRDAHLWLRHGGALVIFPSGEVAPRLRAGRPIDSTWRPTVGRLALQTGAAIVPAHVAGRNSALFYAAGRVHPLLRTALLARELLKKRGQSVTIRFGQPYSARQLQDGPSDTATATAVTLSVRRKVERLAVLPDPLPGVDVAAEIAALPPETRLIERGPFQVYCAESHQIPHALEEIGRLRAVTYHAAGEGTDQDVDLDEFDRHYLHLFAWDPHAKLLVGAYRIGCTDRLVADRGVAALYTRTLFRYGPQFVERLSPALELGRSFVRVEYQRHPMALLALWKGIGGYVVRHPHYRLLFGPVSISARHSDATRSLLAAFLERHYLAPTLAGMVEPRHPRPISPLPASIVDVPASVEEANRLVTSLEPDGQGMPVLLRQYLRLGARLIGFNVDPAFGNVLDALMLVDLTAVERPVLGRYLGGDGAAAFLARHAHNRHLSAA
jgi:putative hemolysin